ncbi:MAG: fatty acid desaturase [Alphaproteobacteria bacterium]|nr:fatty acid desaturase [Alphaproteobacteria bacterium]
MGTYHLTGERARQMRVLPPALLKRLYERSDLHGAAQTAAHIAGLMLGGWAVLASLGTAWVVPAFLVQTFLLVGVFAAMHEAVHYSAFRTRWPNEVLAFMSGATILFNAAFYRHFHLAHHRYTQDPARDPELIASPAPRTPREYWLRLSALPYLKARLVGLVTVPFGARPGESFIHPTAWPTIRRWGWGVLAVYAALLAGSIALETAALVWAWLLPWLAGLPILRAYLLSEHTLCAESDDGFANTRTTLSNPLVRLVMWNLPYHAEHHLFPNVPFHRLPEAHRHLRPHLAHVAACYRDVQAEIRASLT